MSTARQQWGHLKKVLDTLAIPPEVIDQVSDLGNIHYSYNSKDQLVMETKEHFKEENGRSPDEAEALTLTCVQPLGEAAFPAACECQKLLVQPVIIKQKGQFILHLDRMPKEYDRPGFLARAAWISRSGDSAALWVHVDADGCWTVYDALIIKEMPLRAFWQQVEERSKDQLYLADVFSAWEASEENFENQTAGALADICMEMKSRNYPSFIPVSHIDGSRGLAVIDHLLLSTLARYPNDSYWAHRKSKDFLDDAQVYVWPQEVLDALIYARRRTDSWAKDAEETSTETLVGGGGPLVRCLRIFAVSVG